MDVIYELKAAKQLATLPASIQDRVRRIAERLENWPAVSGFKPLRGNLARHFRMRTGDYRVQFRVVGNQISIERIGHRDGFYED